MSRSGESLWRVEHRNEWIDDGEPIGRPSKVVPFSHEDKGMCCKLLGSDNGVVGDEMMHFSALMLRSVGCSLSRSSWNASDTSVGGPKMFPSSRYQE